ncbi:hypothetical protein ACFQGT_16170 [Natrialbaceae archaeon GCM10025810]|uniref:hypothetical protein n=1 Tax=Halovalidus salilacus TaxID=3075124 RepID=UPI00361E3793
MALRIDERANDFDEIDRFDRGVGWIAHPEEHMRRASHALEVDGEVWVFDPVDAEGVDDLFAEFGDVRGVVVLFNNHTRDAAAIAERHDVPVYLPDFFEGVAEELDPETPVGRFGAELLDTGLETRVVRNNRLWQEAALFDPDDGTLLVGETVGTVEYFRAGSERLGVHPMQRLFPPREAFDGLDPERILVGHGGGIFWNADVALERALSNARKRLPRAYAETAWRALPF